MLDNYYCSRTGCHYKTTADTPEEAEIQLMKDGGFDRNKQTECPLCAQDALVFLHASVNWELEPTK